MSEGEGAALAGIRVIELARGAYAWCGKLLAEMGAEVIRVEPPGGLAERGDPPHWSGGRGRGLGFLYHNSSKRSVVLDLDDGADRAVLRALAATSDLFIESLPVGYLDRRGLSCSALRAANPGLIYTAISGFGRRGPHREFLATDLVVAAMAGALPVIGQPEDPPVSLAGDQALLAAATVAACSSLIALRHRQAGGDGQFVDISAQEAMLAVGSICGVGKWLEDGIIPLRFGTALFSAVPSGIYPCRDGRVYLIVNRPRHWQVLARWVHEVTGNEEVLDPMFEGPSSARQPYRELLDLFIGELTARFEVQAFYREAQARHLAVTPLNSASGVVADHHLAARGFFCVPERGPGHGLRYPGPPYRLSATPWRLRHPAPEPGADQPSIAGWLASAATRHLPPEAAVPGPGALSGLRVLEFTAGMAGPWIGRLMAWCGAEVIKVESRNFPDVTRLFVPPREPEAGIQPQLSPWFTDWNAGKRFVGLDLTTAAGAQLARRLAAASDLVIDNNGNGVLEKFGLGFDALLRDHPALILLSSTGYGKVGPDAGYISWGPNIETLSGLSAVSGFPHRACTMTQFAFPDPVSALHGLFAALCALRHRDRTGRGQIVNLSQTEVTAALIGLPLLEVLDNGREPARLGNASPIWAPQGVYPCRGRERWCAISVVTDRQWQRLCELMVRPDLAGDPGLADGAGRRSRQEMLDGEIAGWSRQWDDYALMHALQAAGIPAGVVQNTEDQYRRDPHLEARGFFETIEHRVRGSVVAPGIPLGLTGTPGRTRDAGRPVGCDNRWAFRELLGLAEDEYAALCARGVIQ